MNVTDHLIQQEVGFEERGYAGPFPLFDRSESYALLSQCATYPKWLLPWIKGRHTVHRPMALVGVNPLMLREVSAALGPDLLLWGSQIIRQKPNDNHRWHVDVEHTAWDGVTAWVAMKNVVSGESFSVITGSHRFAVTPQELALRQGLDLKDTAAVAEAARKIDPSSRLVHVKIEDGQFILFKGRLWHGTQNKSSNNRYAMIFQYTRPENLVKIPFRYQYPISAWQRIRPVCLLAGGKDTAGVNRVRTIEEVGGIQDYLAGLLYHLPNNSIQKIRRVVLGA